MEIELVHVKPGDAGLPARVADEVFDAPVDPARLARYLAAPGHHLIVAIADGIVVGQCAAVVHRHPHRPDELFIDEVGVTPALHRRGIARTMLKRMFALGRELGCEESWVGTEPDNTPACGLYESFRAAPVPIVVYEYKITETGVRG